MKNIEVLKEEIAGLMSEISAPRSDFLRQVEGLFKRYIARPEIAEKFKSIIDTVLAAAHNGTLNDVKNSDFGSEYAPIAGFLKSNLRGDLAKGLELPQSVDDLYDAAKVEGAEKIAAVKALRDKRDADKAAADAAEAERVAGLSPEEVEEEAKKKKAKEDYAHLMAVYGGEENYRRGRGLGT